MQEKKKTLEGTPSLQQCSNSQPKKAPFFFCSVQYFTQIPTALPGVLPRPGATWLPPFPHSRSDSGTSGTHIRFLQSRELGDFGFRGGSTFLPIALLPRRVIKIINKEIIIKKNQLLFDLEQGGEAGRMDDQRHGINLQRSQAGSPKASIKK